MDTHNKAIDEYYEITQIEKDLYFFIGRDHNLEQGHRKILNFLVAKYDHKGVYLDCTK